MREIKFRGKILKTSEWVYGYYVYTHDRHRIIYEDYEGFYCEEEVDPETVGQYTGLKDRNGTGIYEGDIVNVNHYGGTPKYETVRFYTIAGFAGIHPFTDSGYHWASHRCEIVGNIYENPELLEGEK